MSNNIMFFDLQLPPLDMLITLGVGDKAVISAFLNYSKESTWRVLLIKNGDFIDLYRNLSM